MLNISEVKYNDIKKKNRNEKLIGFVKAGSFLVFNFILGNDFKV